MGKLIQIVIIIVCLPALSCRNNIRPGNIVNSRGYYIDAEKGDDKNNGSFTDPVKTIDRLNELLQEETGNIFFTGGQIYNGTLIIRNSTGENRDTVCICTRGKKKAIINGGPGEAIRIENCRNIRISNIDARGDGRKTGNKTNGISVVNSRDCLFEQIRTEGFQKSGLELFDCRNIQVQNVLAINNGFCGIHVMGSETGSSGHILIRDCRAENNPGDPAILDNHSGNGILVGVSDSVIIDHCTATNNGWDMPRLGNGPVGIWAWQSDNVIIQYCISYRNRTSKGAKDGGGFDFDGGITNSVIQYCLSYENEGAGYGLFQFPYASDWANNIIRYCISYNDARTTEGAGSIFIWNGSGESRQMVGCLIHNNVFYNSSAPVISFENESTHENFIFCNNIFMGGDNIFSGINSGSSFLGNVWWSTKGTLHLMEYSSLVEWAEAYGQEMMNGQIVGIEADPGLNDPLDVEITDPYQLNALNGYTLKSDSPLRNKGIDIKTIADREYPETDFFGNPVPLGKAPEAGIFEMR